MYNILSVPYNMLYIILKFMWKWSYMYIQTLCEKGAVKKRSVKRDIDPNKYNFLTQLQAQTSTVYNK